jgi:2C-methyl-D-erythritol 2,4-cyclodiphosphate synthase
MNMKNFASFVGLFFTTFAIFAYVTSQTMESTSWELQQIDSSCVERQNRVKKCIEDIQPKVTATMNIFASNGALNKTTAALKNFGDFLSAYKTVSVFKVRNSTLVCGNIPAKISNLTSDIIKTAKSKYEIDRNITAVAIKMNELYGAYVANFRALKESEKVQVTSILSLARILWDESYQFSVTAAIAVYKFARLRVEVYFFKKNYCSCPAKISSNDTAKFATIDSAMKELQVKTDQRETNLRTLSSSVITKIKTVNTDLKLNAALIKLSTYLDTVAEFLKGFLEISTTETINSTLNCDDVTFKVGFIEYRVELFYQTNYEVSKNLSYTVGHQNVLNGLTIELEKQLSGTQKDNVKSVIGLMGNVTGGFRLYSLDVVKTYVKLVQFLLAAVRTRQSTCSCTDSVTTNGTSKSATMLG